MYSNEIIGRRYIVNSKQWYDDNKNADGYVFNPEHPTDKWEAFAPHHAKYCGMTYASSTYEEGFFEFFIPGKPSLTIPSFAVTIDPTDKRGITEKHKSVKSKLLETPWLYHAHCGENSGEGVHRYLTEDNVKPCYDTVGNECLLFPALYGEHLMKLSEVEQFIDAATNDVSISTSMSFIRGEMQLGENKESLKQEFKYGR